METFKESGSGESVVALIINAAVDISSKVTFLLWIHKGFHDLCT